MEWIRAKDRMPKKVGDYLICVKTGKVLIARYYEPYEDIRPECFIHYGKIRSDVVAWMPLPPIPEDTAEEARQKELDKLTVQMGKLRGRLEKVEDRIKCLSTE